ncbi:kinase-like domain-containing protein [Paraphysoderma sedebokerense]|nr:kinase-like domain-containing protein [Paraphysoderma sedebokerense]
MSAPHFIKVILRSHAEPRLQFTLLLTSDLSWNDVLVKVAHVFRFPQGSVENGLVVLRSPGGQIYNDIPQIFNVDTIYVENVVPSVAHKSSKFSTTGIKANLQRGLAKIVPKRHASAAPISEKSAYPKQDTRPIQEVKQAPEPKLISQKYLERYPLHPVLAQRYQLKEELGSGGFGFVVTAIRLSDDVEVAVKFIFRNKVPRNAWVKDPVLGSVPSEISFLRQINHPNVIGFLDFYQDRIFFYLIMELHGAPWSAQKKSQPSVTSGPPQPPTQSIIAPAVEPSEPPSTPDMTKLRPPSPSKAPSPSKQSAFSKFIPHKSPNLSKFSLKQHKSTSSAKTKPVIGRRNSMDLFECIEQHSRLSENSAKIIFRQVVDAVYYLHTQKQIIHRDIKDENIVVDSNFNVKLIDFGSASYLPKPGHYFDRFAGTVQYASPQILRGEKYRGPEQEVWSLGILLFTILSGGSPFQDPQQVLSHSYIRPKVPVSDDCLHLLNWMLAREVINRATIHQVKAHRWLKPDEESDLDLRSLERDLTDLRVDETGHISVVVDRKYPKPWSYGTSPPRTTSFSTTTMQPSNNQSQNLQLPQPTGSSARDELFC